MTPRLVVSDAAKLVEFLKQAFGATGDLLTERPSVMRIGDSLVMVSSVGTREAMPAFLYFYVERQCLCANTQSGKREEMAT